MTTNENGQPEQPRFQFRLRTLLWVVTGTCLMLGLFRVLLPQDFPVEIEIMLYVYLAAITAFAVWEYRRQRWIMMLPRETVAVNVDVKWLRRARSPLVMGPVATLTGVSITFAPATLLWLGQVEGFGVAKWIAAPLCFAIIYLVPGFYMRLAGEVLGQLVKLETPEKNS